MRLTGNIDFIPMAIPACCIAMTDAYFIVAALYKFVHINDVAAVRAQLLDVCKAQNIKGTLLVAPEGLNGTIAGKRTEIDHVLSVLRALPECAELEHKESFAVTMPFKRLKVRLKREIVTMGVPDIDPVHRVGTYVEPQQWNALISDPDIVLIDTRNDFEVAYGTFDQAINPQTTSFRQFPLWFDAHAEEFKGKKIAMFCTGGIRCEKATAYAKSKGFEHVYHLKGGILKYLETMPQEASKWQGDCFVFDERVALGHGLEITGSAKVESEE
jgi:UPF0176 protein